MKKVKKDKVKLGKKEYIFNLISVIILGALLIAYGGRFIYYFIYEINETERRDNTLLYYMEGRFTEEDEEFYKVNEEFFFKNDSEYNYVNYANNIYRILSVNENGEIKLVLDDSATTFMWGNDKTYEESNLNTWLGNSENGVYYNMLIKPEEHLANTTYSIDTFNDNKLTKNNDEVNALITTLTLEDYITAGGKDSFLNNGNYFWLLGTANDNNLFVNSNGDIEEDITYGSYGVRPVITLKKDIVLLRGKGEEDNPFVLDLDDEITYINQYVKLGEDTFKIIEDNNDVLKLASTNYIEDVSGNLLHKFGSEEALFNTEEYGSIAYYLNNTYYENLSYKDSLVTCEFNLGSVSDVTNNSYDNIFTSKEEMYVGMMNIFDLNTLELNDYYYMNNTGLVSDTQFVNNNSGILQKVQIEEEKSIVPVVCINKSSIIDGSGASYSPYTLISEGN